MILKLKKKRKVTKIYQSPISINNVDINKIVVSNQVSCSKNGLKSFTGYKDAKTIRPSCIFLLKRSTYRRDFDKTKCIFF